MEWFMGSIPEAIGKSRQSGLLFIVYIEGKSHPTWMNDGHIEEVDLFRITATLF